MSKLPAIGHGLPDRERLPVTFLFMPLIFNSLAMNIFGPSAAFECSACREAIVCLLTSRTGIFAITFWHNRKSTVGTPRRQEKNRNEYIIF
jgi:hypothetical protein